MQAITFTLQSADYENQTIYSDPDLFGAVAKLCQDFYTLPGGE
jgi:hypothetical protein